MQSFDDAAEDEILVQDFRGHDVLVSTLSATVATKRK